jgi:anti-sigma28 factor (negative regulator of flagellin synthesis)
MINAVQSQASVLASQVSQRGDNKNETIKIETKETDRVAAIKEQIASGTYAINLSQTAQAVTEELLG